MRLTKSVLTNISLVVVAGLGGWFAYDSIGLPTAKTAASATRTATIGSGTVMTTISSSGNVTAPKNISVNFATSGKLTEIDVKVGQKVTQGQVLARVDSTAAKANLDSAKAQLASAQSNLSELEGGSTALEKQSYELSNEQAAQQVTQAQAQLTSAQQQLTFDTTNLAAAITKAQEQLATDQASESQTLANDQTALTQAANSQNLQITVDTAQLNADVASAASATPPTNCPTSSPSTLAACSKVDQDELKIQQDSQSTVSAQQKLAADTLNSQQKLQSDQDAITSAETAQTQGLAKDQQSIKSAQQSISNAQLSQQVTENNNAQKTAAPEASQLETDQAQVEQAQATVDTDQATLDATALTAPADGTVGDINDTVGQTVSAGTTSTGSETTTSGSTTTAFLTLTNLSDLQVVADIDEADSSKVAVDSPATVTLNAITGKEFAAHVISIANSSTVSSNVVEYEVTFQLDNTDPTIKPGMTASVSVTTDKVDGVLNVTSSAVRTSGGSSYVLVVQPDGTQKQVDVVVGLKGDTTTEISGAIKAGETVALPAATVAKAATSTNNSTTTSRLGPSTQVFVGGGGGGFGGGGFGGRG